MGMKRHEALHPLSHDHQNALARALRLRKAADRDGAARRTEATAFLEFVDARIAPHFLEEEAMLDRAIGISGTDAIRQAREHLGDEHARLRASFEHLRAELRTGELDPELLHAVGQALTDHIRYEERELFEQLQQELDDHALHAIVGGSERAGG